MRWQPRYDRVRGSAVRPGTFFAFLALTLLGPWPSLALPEFARVPPSCPTRATRQQKASGQENACSLASSRRPGTENASPQSRRPPGAPARAVLAARAAWARDGCLRGAARGPPAREGRGGGGWVPLATGGKDTRESKGAGSGWRRARRKGGSAAGGRRERGGGRPGGRRERGRQAEGGLISMQQRSRARLHCFNTSPLLRANLSPFSRRTLLPQMLLFSNETDN